MKRQLALIPAAILLATTLAACSSNDDSEPPATDASGESTACADPGSVSEALTFEGNYGEPVELTSELPAQATTLEKSTIVEGDGAEITADDEVITLVQVFNGRDGVLLEHTTTLLSNNPSTYADWVTQSINCSQIGDRVAIVVPAVDVFGAENVGTADSDQLNADDSLVIVSDFTDTLLKQAEGEEIDSPADLPQVVVDETGLPDITMPKDTDAPTELTVQTLVRGEGDVVEAGDTVFVHYRGVIWETGEEFNSSWSRGQYATFSAATAEEAAEVGASQPVIRGFRDALVGQTIGSRVLSVVPAEDGGYGGQKLKSDGFAEDAVMVFVLDILWATPPVQF